MGLSRSHLLKQKSHHQLHSMDYFGLGTWPLSGNAGMQGYGRINESTAKKTVIAALDAGVTFFDTADIYGAGFAERLLGELVSPLGDNISICTKGGWDLESNAFNPDLAFIERRIANSQDRLRCDRIAIYLLHSPPPSLIGVREIYRPLVRLKRRGVLGAIGVSVNAIEDAWLTLDLPEIEVVQFPYNFLLDRFAPGLLQALHAAGKSIIAREVLGNGLLTGKYRHADQFDADDFRAYWLPGQIESIVDAMNFWKPFLKSGETWTEFAWRFVLDRTEIDRILVGASEPGHVIELYEFIKKGRCSER